MPTKNSIRHIRQALIDLAEPGRKTQQESYFKTGEGEYGAGDVFRGVRVPNVRKVAKQFQDVSLDVVEELLHSKYHEDRQTALFIMVNKFLKAEDSTRERIYRLYLKNTGFINNWDLVDGSAAHIVGAYLLDKDKKVLYTLAQSESLWERRIAMLSTLYYIKQNQFKDTFQIAAILLDDDEDLIHKAVGWMLREVGNRSIEAEEEFLKPRYHTMPRTMLRYAIEKFPETKRVAYLNGKI